MWSLNYPNPDLTLTIIELALTYSQLSMQSVDFADPYVEVSK